MGDGGISEPADKRVKFFYPVAEVEAFYSWWKLSGFTITRDGKPWEDQDTKWLNDLSLYHHCRLWAEQEAKKKKGK